jgi:aminopeptidase N
MAKMTLQFPPHTQQGYPLLHVTATRNDSDAVIGFKVTQTRFFDNDVDSSPTLWHVPVVFARGDQYQSYLGDMSKERLFSLPTRNVDDDDEIEDKDDVGITVTVGQVDVAKQHV